MFAAIVPEDTYTVASAVHDLLVKTHAADIGKIELIKELVWEHLQMDRFLEVADRGEVRLTQRPAPPGRRPRRRPPAVRPRPVARRRALGRSSTRFRSAPSAPGVAVRARLLRGRWASTSPLIGVLAAIPAVVAIVAAPAWGLVADRLGDVRAPLVLGGRSAVRWPPCVCATAPGDALAVPGRGAARRGDLRG